MILVLLMTAADVQEKCMLPCLPANSLNVIAKSEAKVGLRYVISVAEKVFVL